MNPKPKILIAADTFYPKVDGTLRFIEEFVKRAKDNFDLSLLVPQFNHQKDINKLKPVFLETSKLIELSTYPSMKISLQNVKKIKNAVREAEIVFVQGPALISYLSIYYAHKYHKKIIFYAHMSSWDLFEKNAPLVFSKLLSKTVKRVSVKLINKCDLLLIPYYELKDELRNAGIKTPMQVAKLGIDIERFIPSKDIQASKKKIKLPNKSIIGYVGRISGEKNTLVLLEAFKKLDPRKFFLLVVGDGQPEIVGQFKKNKNCKVTGFVKNVEDYLQAMDIFVMPSLVETTSLATLEAMSCGLPVIVTKVGFMKEYIVKNHNGLFFPRANSSLLALKINNLSRNPKLREKLSHNARKTIAYSFSWERSINRIKKILLTLYYRQ